MAQLLAVPCFYYVTATNQCLDEQLAYGIASGMHKNRQTTNGLHILVTL